MRFDLIALDLDDTLLHGDLSISEANRLALARAHAGGAKIVLASGRTIHSMRKYAELLGLVSPDDFIVATNGAEIVETSTGRVLSESRIDEALCLEIVQAVEALGFPWQIYVGGRILYRGWNRWTEEDMRLTGMPSEAIRDVGAALSGGQLKFVVPGDPGLLSSARDRLAKRFGDRTALVISKPYFLEFLPAGVDKGRALADLVRRFRLKRERVLAMGDAMNDIAMLEYAGFSCAPANAIPEAKSVASWVSALTNDEDFVADALGRWL